LLTCVNLAKLFAEHDHISSSPQITDHERRINMRYGVIGTGMVGKTLASKLISLSHEVKMGSRSASSETAAAWVKEAGKGASQGTFADAAAFGDVILVCTRGDVTLDAVRSAGAANLTGKVVIDVSNPLDFSKGMPPSMIPEFSNTNSLGEAVQKLLPASYVVKTLNTINCAVMVNPAMLQGDSEESQRSPSLVWVEKSH
jgi:predicted dinucleotide-binding enzyme